MRLFLSGYCTVTCQHRHWFFLPTASWCWCGVAMVTWCRCVTSRETSKQQIFHWDSLSAFPSLLCVLLLSITSQPLFSDKRSSPDKTWQKGKESGRDIRTLFTFGVSLRVHFNVSHLDICWRLAYRSKGCITKAESGLKGVRKEQIECTALCSFLSLSPLFLLSITVLVQSSSKIHLYCPCVLIPIK